MKAIIAAALVLGTLCRPCVADEFTEQQVEQLERKCEEAREARLKPLRDAEIARCKNEKRNDPEYCERFYRDFGDASRTPTGIKPRMFHDLPECQAAFKARQGLVRQ
jgi:hypothetical protein